MRRPKTNNINQLNLSSELIEIISQRYSTVVELWKSFMVMDENDERLNHPYLGNYKNSQKIKQSLTAAGFCTLPGTRYFIQYIDTLNEDDCKYFYDHLSGNSQKAIAAKYSVTLSISTKGARKYYDLMERFTNAYSNICVSNTYLNDYVILDLSNELLTKLISYQRSHYSTYRKPSYIGHLLVGLSDDKFIKETGLENKDIEEIHSKFNDLRYKLRGLSIISRMDDLVQCRFDVIGFPGYISEKLSHHLSKSSTISDLTCLLYGDEVSAILNDCELEESRDRLQNFIDLHGYTIRSKQNSQLYELIGRVIAYHKLDWGESSIAWGIVTNEYPVKNGRECTILPIQPMYKSMEISQLESVMERFPVLQKTTRIAQFKLNAGDDDFSCIVNITENTFIMTQKDQQCQPELLLVGNTVLNDLHLTELFGKIVVKEEE